MPEYNDAFSALKGVLGGVDDEKQAIAPEALDPNAVDVTVAQYQAQDVVMVRVEGDGVTRDIPVVGLVTVDDPDDLGNAAAAMTFPAFQPFSTVTDDSAIYFFSKEKIKSMDISWISPPVMADEAKIIMEFWNGSSWSQVNLWSMDGNAMAQGDGHGMDMRMGAATGGMGGDMYDQGGDFAAGGHMDFAASFGIAAGDATGTEGSFQGVSDLSDALMMDHMQFPFDYQEFAQADDFFTGDPEAVTGVFAFRVRVNDAGGLSTAPLWFEAPKFNFGDTIKVGGVTIYEDLEKAPTVSPPLNFHFDTGNDITGLALGNGFNIGLGGMAFNPASGKILWSFRVPPGMSRRLMFDVQWYTDGSSSVALGDAAFELQIKSSTVGFDDNPTDASVATTTSEMTMNEVVANTNYLSSFMFDLTGAGFGTGAMVYLELAIIEVGGIDGGAGDRIKVLGVEALCKLWKSF
jgi:hypothetical protein